MIHLLLGINYTYATLYYILFTMGISVKYSKIKKDKIRKIIYITLFSLRFIFAIISIYKYYEVNKFKSIFSYSSASIAIISWIYYSLCEK